ncbi:MAG: hypothetical protein ABGX22_20270, partial [Pirellulaceae bacterium]
MVTSVRHTRAGGRRNTDRSIRQVEPIHLDAIKEKDRSIINDVPQLECMEFVLLLSVQNELGLEVIGYNGIGSGGR